MQEKLPDHDFTMYCCCCSNTIRSGSTVCFVTTAAATAATVAVAAAATLPWVLLLLCCHAGSARLSTTPLHLGYTAVACRRVLRCKHAYAHPAEHMPRPTLQSTAAADGAHSCKESCSKTAKDQRFLVPCVLDLLLQQHRHRHPCCLMKLRVCCCCC